MDVLSAALHDLVDEVTAAPDLAAAVRRRHRRRHRLRVAAAAGVLTVAGVGAVPALLSRVGGSTTVATDRSLDTPAHPTVDGVDLGYVPDGWAPRPYVELEQSRTYGGRTTASLLLTRDGGSPLSAPDYYAVTVMRSGATDLDAFAALTRSGGRRVEDLQVHGVRAVLALPGPNTVSPVVRLLWVERGVTLSVSSQGGTATREAVLAIATALSVGEVTEPTDATAARAAITSVSPRPVDGLVFDSPSTALLLLAPGPDGRTGQGAAELVDGKWVVTVRNS